jgi:hypothetical protein
VHAAGRKTSPFVTVLIKALNLNLLSLQLTKRKNTGFVVAKRHLINHFATALIRKFNFFK